MDVGHKQKAYTEGAGMNMPVPRKPLTERSQEANKQPFYTLEPLEGSSGCKWADIRSPRLGAYPKKAFEIVWEEELGQGLDGIVWRASMNGTTHAIKIFWEQTPPSGNRYWAVQRECQNAALLQILQTSIVAGGSIYVNGNPRTRYDAADNLRAFSAELRGAPPVEDGGVCLTAASLPRLRTCHGWIKIKGSAAPRSKPSAVSRRSRSSAPRHRALLPDEEYWAIVYEYIPESTAPLEDDEVQKALDFYWLCGFSFTLAMRAENWIAGILLDFSEIMPPWAAGWSRPAYKHLHVGGWGREFFQGRSPMTIT